MAEPGGTTTQSGIRYQNSIAALYLGRLLDQGARSASERVIEVRVESPDHVDDIAVHHADGGHTYIQAKEDVATSGDVWKKMWLDFESQHSTSAGERHELILAVSVRSKAIGDLQEACDRTRGKNNAREWMNSLSEQHKTIIDKVIKALTKQTQTAAFDLLSVVYVRHQPHDRIESDELKLWMPTASEKDTVLFTILRDFVGGNARIRAIFRAPELLERLHRGFVITIHDAPGWGMGAYRQAIAKTYGILLVPGTTLSGPIDEVFEWLPMHNRSGDAPHRDFEEEDPRWRGQQETEFVDFQGYPRTGKPRAVIDASAGFGKTTMLNVIAHKTARDPVYIPAFIPLADLADQGVTVLDYLTDALNHSYDVTIDWERMCESGRAVVLFDGFDELSSENRTQTVAAVQKFAGRFPNAPYLLTVRDSTAIPTSLDVPVFGIQRLDDSLVVKLARRYAKAGAHIDPDTLYDHMRRHPDLAHLLRIPLFLALVLATAKPGDDLPKSRSELMERYLNVLFDPKRHKPHTGDVQPPDDLREAAEFLAYQGLESEGLGLNWESARRRLRPKHTDAKAGAYIDCLLRFGVLRQSGGAWLRFAFPIVQEYLAALYMVDKEPDAVAERFRQIVHRPWAQAIQFALEMHPDATTIIEDQLHRPDDAFHTALRLVGRCIVNGAKISTTLRADVGDRLAAAWACESWSISNSIGYLIADGFTDPLPAQAKASIIDGWALQQGGAEIVTALQAPLFTRTVLEALLKQRLDYTYYLHGWQAAVNIIAADAFDMYLDRARASSTTNDESVSLSSLIKQLPTASIPPARWRNAARDENLTPLIRLAAYHHLFPTLYEEAWCLVTAKLDAWLADTDKHPIRGYYQSRIFFWRFEQAREHFLLLAQRSDVSPNKLNELLESINDPALDGGVVAANLRCFATHAELPAEWRFLCTVALAVRGDSEAAERAIDILPSQPPMNLAIWCWHLGYFSKSMALRGLDALQKLNLDSKDLAQIFSGFYVGLNYIMKPSFNLSGVLDTERRHPAAEAFVAWVSEALPNFDLPLGEKLRTLGLAKRIGCTIESKEVLDLLNQTHQAYMAETDKDLAYKLDWAIYSGLDDFRTIVVEHNMDLVWRLAEQTAGNMANQAVGIIVTTSGAEAIPRLIKIYADSTDNWKRANILSSLERLAGRYGKRIVRDSNALKQEDW